MSNVIDFFSMKKRKHEEQLFNLFRKANSFQNREQIDKLVDEKKLTVEDHKRFLAFLAHLQAKNIEPTELFQSVLTLSKYQFEQRYPFNWFTVVQNCLTFLTIIKEKNHKQYERFLSVR
ncbi:hypothetical protein [Ureibacillus sp. FSL W8-0352]|uniref:hypothetical protein n=1 Tax=Ureibacillus sp. FSL W8-0352 TaxID=2954596 RepID=UPI0030FB14D4